MLARLFTHPFAANYLCLLFSAWQQHQPLAQVPAPVYRPLMWKFVCFGVMKFRAINFLLRQLQVAAATGLVVAGWWLVVEGQCWPAFSHTRLQQTTSVYCSQHGSSTSPWRRCLHLSTDP